VNSLQLVRHPFIQRLCFGAKQENSQHKDGIYAELRGSNEITSSKAIIIEGTNHSYLSMLPQYAGSSSTIRPYRSEM